MVIGELSTFSVHANFDGAPTLHHGLTADHWQFARGEHAFPTPVAKIVAQEPRVNTSLVVTSMQAKGVIRDSQRQQRRNTFPQPHVISFVEETVPARNTLTGEYSFLSVSTNLEGTTLRSALVSHTVPEMLSHDRKIPVDSNHGQSATPSEFMRQGPFKAVSGDIAFNRDAYRLQENTPFVRNRGSPASSSTKTSDVVASTKWNGDTERFYEELPLSVSTRQVRERSLELAGLAAPVKLGGHTNQTHDVIMRVSENARQAQDLSPSNADYVMPLSANTRHRQNSFSPATFVTLANATPLSTDTDEEHALADEAWQLVDKYFVSPSFNGVDWAAERKKLASASLSSRKATYAALRKSFRKLSDRYTRLLSPYEMNGLRRFDVSGVGLLLTTDATGSLVVATDPPGDSAAARAGIVRGDVLQAIEGVSVDGDAAFSVSERMQGPDGSDIHVTFREKEPVTLRRSFPPARGSAATKAKLVNADDGSKLGYIRLSEFRASSREEVGRAAQKLVNEGADWIALDLRGNGGGVFEGALEIAGLFEGPNVPVARVEGRAGASRDVPGEEETYSSRLVDGETQVPAGVDLAVLIDRDSASSSEVLAGALRDRCRGALVGERSYGKGVIQGVFGLSDGGGVVVTVAEYRTPNGDRIQGVGLMPDVSKKMGGLEKAARAMGIEKVDETTIGVEREQVQEAIRMCTARNESAL